MAEYLYDKFLESLPQKEIELGDDYTYAKYLEHRSEQIEKILQKLVLAHGEGRSLLKLIAKIEDWMGDDWHFYLSDRDMKRWENLEISAKKSLKKIPKKI